MASDVLLCFEVSLIFFVRYRAEVQLTGEIVIDFGGVATFGLNSEMCIGGLVPDFFSVLDIKFKFWRDRDYRARRMVNYFFVESHFNASCSAKTVRCG